LAWFDGNAELVGLAPFYLSSRRISVGVELSFLRLIGDGSEDSDNLDIPVRPGFERHVADSLLRYLRDSSRVWDVCQLNTLPPDSPVARCLLEQLDCGRWPHYEYQRPSSAIELPVSWDAFLAQMKERTNLRYYTRRLEKAHKTCVYRCDNESSLPACLERFFDLHNKRWEERGQPGTFASAERRRFYYEMASSFLRRGWLEFWLLDVDGSIVAADFNFRHKETVFSLQSGFDPEFAGYRVGFVLKGYLLRQLVSDGVRRYDFLGGMDPNKSRWGAAVSSYLDLHFARSFTRGGTYLQLFHWTAHTKEYVRTRLPSPAWSLLRRAYHVVRDRKPPTQ
jgi:hypothetical protein